MRKIILASTSPRRKQILEMIGLKFKVVDSKYIEKFNPRLRPKGQAEFLSLQKAEAVLERFKDAIIISSDQVINLDGETLGKPNTEQNAKKMLQKMQGREHMVITAFTIIDTVTRKSVTKSVETKVFLKKLSNKEIEWYVGTKEPLDRAGSYAVQGKGAIFVEKIEGDYFNVVGLPIATIVEELKKFGIRLNG